MEQEAAEEGVGYHELMGRRQRYRLLDLEQLCWRVGTSSVDELRRLIEAGITEGITQGAIKRMRYWTQALGVGSQEFLKRSQGLIFTRSETEIVEQPSQIFVLQETPTPYIEKRTSKKNLLSYLHSAVCFGVVLLILEGLTRLGSKTAPRSSRTTREPSDGSGLVRHGMTQ